MTRRQLIDVPLQAVPTDVFQATGFPDLGPATFEKYDTETAQWIDALLVESAQSMANRLEAVAWDKAANEPVPLLERLPWVRVVAADDGRYLTSSRVESHRLASVFVRTATAPSGETMTALIADRLGLRDDTPHDHRRIASAIFSLDPMCLIHGVFFSDAAWLGQPKIARALTAMIEAVDVHEVNSGGVKRDHVRHKLGDTGGTAEGYGSVPFQRREFTARRITAHFSIDGRQLASYGLSEQATELLDTICLWQVRSLLDTGLRLRTACEFEPISDELVDRSGQSIPSTSDLAWKIGELCGTCPELTNIEPLREVIWKPGRPSK